MRMFYILFIVLFLFSSCNADIYKTSDDNFGNLVESGVVSTDKFDENIAPSNVKASMFTYPDRIEISWSGVKHAARYIIERKTGEAEWKEIAEVNGSIHSYADEYSASSSEPLQGGIKYNYRVYAKSSNGVAGIASTETEGALLYSPANVTATKGDPNIEGITLSWDYIEGISSYEIFMRTSDEVPFTTVETIRAVNSADDCSYTYPITDTNNYSYSGMELQFAVASVSPRYSSIVSIEHDDANVNYSIGYSYVKGAPAAVTNLTADKGKNTTASGGIKITWDDQGEDIDYIVYRSSSGGAESKIYKIYNSQTLDRTVPGLVSFVDNSADVLDTGVEYTYSVIATAEMDNGVTAKGEASYTTGYLFSPPENVTFEKLIYDDTNGYGFQFSFDAPLGLQTEEDRTQNSAYAFNIYGWNKAANPTISSNNYTNAKSISAREALASNIKNSGKLVTTISSSDIDENGKYHATVYFGENNYDMFTVSLSDGNGKESLFSKIPFEWKGATYKEAIVSQNKPTNSSPNANGVYPVTITVSFNDYGFNYIKSLEILDYEGNSIASYDSIDSTSVNTVEASSASAVPGKKYSYIIKTTDMFGYTLETPSAEGYGAVTFEVYKDMFESICLKPWEKTKYLAPQYAAYWPNSQIGKMIAAGNSSDLGTQMGSLGTVDDKDHYRGGTFHYFADMEGIGGQIYFEYKEFGESDYMYHTGNYEMHVDSGGTGSASSNTNGFDIFGWYPGHISIKNIKVSRKAFTGSYTITQQYGDSTSATKEVTV